ncbi:MAG: DUF4129 domain-containing protein, partial [Acidobacteriota bacterium]
SWVDIYFPPYGWIEFEPTGGRAPIQRTGEWQAPESKGRTVGPPFAPSPWGSTNWTALLGTGIALCVLAGVALLVLDGWRFERQPPKETIGAAYYRMTGLARGLGVPLRPADTPSETAARVADRLAALGRGRWEMTTERVGKDVDALTLLYLQSCYSPRPPQVADRALAIRLWRRLRPRLWLLGLWQRARRAAREFSGK